MRIWRACIDEISKYRPKRIKINAGVSMKGLKGQGGLPWQPLQIITHVYDSSWDGIFLI